MKVPSESTSKDPVRNLDEQIRRKIDSKETELENLAKIYDQRIAVANTLGEDKYEKSVDRNNQRIVAANKEYEDKLKGYQDSLTQTKSDLETSQNNLTDKAKEDQANLKTQAEEKYLKIYENAKENQESLFNKSRNDAKQLSEKSHHDKTMRESRAKQQLTAFAQNLSETSKTQEENLKKQLESEQSAMSRTLLQDKLDTQMRLAESTQKNKQLEQDQKRVQEDELKFVDQHHAELIKQKQQDFLVRYQRLAQEHDDVLNALKAKLDKTTQEAIEANRKDLQAIYDVKEDPFYQLEVIKPQVTEDAKNYYIHLEVPQHEKENVHLMAHGRELKVTVSKKYMTTVNDPDGSSNHISKTKLYSKEFPTKDILNPKQISQKYENGILSFKVAKL